MNQNSTSLSQLLRRLYKLRFTLQQIQQGRQRAGSRQVQALLKQIRRAARKAISLGTHPAAKACGVMAVALMLSATTEAQCNTFSSANGVNPITINHLPGGREPFFVDIDGDGDLDCYVLDGIYNYDAPFLLKNIGTNQFPVYQSAPAESGFPLGVDALSFAPSNAAFVDIDGDGDYDCFLAQSYSGNFNVHIKYFENQGTATSPHFVENEAKNPLSTENGSYFISFAFADIDGDGDLDVHIIGDYFEYDLINTGTKTNPVFSDTRNYKGGVHWYDERAYYDWNNDGLLDYVEKGTYYKNIGPKSNPQYVQDAANGPNFQGAIPHILIDLNGDGKSEAFDKQRSLYSVAPVPVVDTQTVHYQGRNLVRFSLSPTSASYTYQAFRNGAPVANSNHPYFIAQANGVYSFTVTDSCGTGFSVPYRIKYSSAAGAEKTELAAVTNLAVTATAYPNPFTSYLTLQLPPSVSSATAKVFDLQGRQLLSQQVTGSHIHIGDGLAKGVYLLQLIQNNTIIYSQKMVKQ